MSPDLFTLPAQSHSPTSLAAAEAIKPDAATLRGVVLAHITEMGVDGVTDDEGQRQLAMCGNTYRPRRRELELAGLVIDSGRTRKTASGREAVVWVAKNTTKN